MPRFENELFGIIGKKDWLNVGFDVTRQNDPIDSLMSDTRTENLVAEWETLASEYQIPVMAQFHGWDTEAQQTTRVPVDGHSIEKGLIKVKINQSERMRALKRSGISSDQLYSYIMDDGLNLAEQVFTRSKVAKNELLATGKVTIKENGLDLTVDYGVPQSHTNLELDFGAGATKSIPAQLNDLVQSAADNGTILNGILTSRKNVSRLRQDVAIQKQIGGIYSEGSLVPLSALQDYLASEFGINRIVTNDLRYALPRVINPTTGRPTVRQKRYFPEEKISFFAANTGGIIGTGLWGNPPEVDVPELKARQASGMPYVYISQWHEEDPAVTWMKASALYMPVLFSPDSLYIAKAKETAA